MKHICYCSQPKPAYLERAEHLPSLLRLQQVGMNCGVEYTSFPRYASWDSYQRYEHSVGCAEIVRHFGGTEEMVLSALFHDIATPCFSHVIDFLNGDYSKQESTEERTLSILSGPDVTQFLNEEGISLENVSDYKRYPLCDNASPRLSADRLEYTISNMVNFGFTANDEAADLFSHVFFGQNDQGEPELVFVDLVSAKRFASLALECSYVYLLPEDRGASELLARLLSEAIAQGVIERDDLWKTEPFLIDKLCKNKLFSEKWTAYRRLSIVDETSSSLCVKGKLRYIDPYVDGRGRLSEIDPEFRERIQGFLNFDFDQKFGLR